MDQPSQPLTFRFRNHPDRLFKAMKVTKGSLADVICWLGDRFVSFTSGDLCCCCEEVRHGARIGFGYDEDPHYAELGEWIVDLPDIGLRPWTDVSLDAVAEEVPA